MCDKEWDGEITYRESNLQSYNQPFYRISKMNQPCGFTLYFPVHTSNNHHYPLGENSPALTNTYSHKAVF